MEFNPSHWRCVCQDHPILSGKKRRGRGGVGERGSGRGRGGGEGEGEGDGERGNEGGKVIEERQSMLICCFADIHELYLGILVRTGGAEGVREELGISRSSRSMC